MADGKPADATIVPAGGVVSVGGIVPAGGGVFLPISSASDG
jgi:hypothetical protein